MGLKHFSSSSYERQDPPVPPNPNPRECNILAHYIIGPKDAIILKVRYEGCTTFKGEKILVYLGATLAELKAQHSLNGLDPHFSSSTVFYSPVARFIPTKEGMFMAIKFCEVFVNNKLI